MDIATAKVAADRLQMLQKKLKSSEFDAIAMSGGDYEANDDDASLSVKMVAW